MRRVRGQEVTTAYGPRRARRTRTPDKYCRGRRSGVALCRLRRAGLTRGTRRYRIASQAPCSRGLARAAPRPRNERVARAAGRAAAG
ncbi:MAG: hypothetical protein AVDCRST_MAG64-2289 [uncultured Phycisphaerae bacterium]|uniref:Uncharacterized protein n=1 Tax=uncultured Phycisphaerae bacterium TaxID=904963 RepID=A0A6J4PHU2_9BACT|nr:MAG: hypothetical protein AVDCRST_MAG64-2289 [uncultured Phycisphaerae bacterium]